MPENLPRFDGQPVNMGGILAWEFLLMHFVEVRRWQDIRKKDSVNAVSALCFLSSILCSLWLPMSRCCLSRLLQRRVVGACGCGVPGGGARVPRGIRAPRRGR